MSVAIVDYGSGNLHSAAKAFERAARESGHSQPIVVTRDPDAVRKADRVVLPGVGAFADCKRGLEAVPGMVDALTENVRKRGKPFFGICVGMQSMASRGPTGSCCRASAPLPIAGAGSMRCRVWSRR
jgi:glutamine amidotransferase